MKLKTKTARDFINPLLSRKSIDEDLFKQFKQSLESYKKSLAEQLATNQTEPNIVTNSLKPFFDALGYNSQSHSQKGQSGIDLAIIKDLKPAVVIEAKAPNSKDMINQNDLYKKAFYEAVFYFMVERGKNNNALFHIIITDFHNWFVFDAKDFDRLFWRNSSIKKIYTTYTDKNQLAVNTKDVYSALEEALPSLMKDLLDPEEIEAAHFNFKLDIKEKELVAIYKLLSADGLLKEFKANEANSLDKNFYNELLYILGLEEAKDGGKKVIGQAKAPQNGTLYENISNKLAQYQKPNDFESVIKLIIIWVNRILFLKLLESQICNWANAKNDKFLYPSKLNQYDQLETLFFEVLAKPINIRTVVEYNNVPYLNSSLFEIHSDEKTGITIATLADDLTIDYFNKTVLTENKQRKTGKVSTLPYLLEFLDAYNFANDSDDEITLNAKSLISASVLGLIFEKINGYKDGSFYTPSFITMYMARETITKAVIDKFNVAYGWQCKTLIDLHNKEPNIAEANALINSITICDPAVGSGHFLVSALNEILFIKSKIGVLVDEAGYKLKGYSFSIESDELIIKDDVGEIFEYKKGNETKTRLQKTLFKEKQTIIENCLFGVDINPNSVNICRLRLWIELLKNAYYKPDNTLDTLPNIDINIKCGNSLISRFGLTDDLNSKTIKAEIKDYKAKIADYKQNISTKQLVLQAIDNIKVKFQQTLKSTHNTTKKLNDALIQYVAKYSLDGLTSAQKLKAIDEFKLMGKQSSLLDDSDDLTDKARLKKVLENAWLAVEEIESGKIYQNAFEWRFEFPEVLNEGGDFVGFDVVIGNPPYGVKYNQYEKHYFIQKYETVEDIYTSFIELSGKITSVGAIVGLITPITWLTGSKYLKTRLLLLKDYSLIKAINLPYNIFQDAYVDTGLYFFQQKSEEHSFVFEFEPKTQIDKVNFAEIEFKKYSRNEWGIKEDKKINLNESDNSVFQKIDAITTKLESYAITARGILANKEDYRDEINAEKRKKVFIGNLNRYSIEDKYSSIEYGANLKEKPMSYDVFKDKRILVRRIISRQFRIMATIASDEFICKKDIYIVKLTDNTLSHEFVLGLLNSKLISYYKTKNSGSAKKDDFTQITLTDIRQIPIPIISLTLQEPLIQLVAQVILAKQNQQDTRQLEAEIDAMVYQLYQLTPDEISVIEAVN